MILRKNLQDTESKKKNKALNKMNNNELKDLINQKNLNINNLDLSKLKKSELIELLQ